MSGADESREPDLFGLLLGVIAPFLSAKELLVAKLGTINLRGLLALLLGSCGCCSSQWCQLPDDCAEALCCTQLGWVVQDACRNGCPLVCCECGGGADCSCGVPMCDDSDCCEPPRQCRAEPGPPPVCYEPPMPPKFLPVPARSVFSKVNMNAPTHQQRQFEMGFGPEIVFPAGD